MGRSRAFVNSIFGRLILFGYTWALIHHMLGGIRHLIWDTGHGFAAAASANGSRSRPLVGSVALTLVLLDRWLLRGRSLAMSEAPSCAPRSRACAGSARPDPAPSISGGSGSRRSPTCRSPSPSW